MGQAPKGIVVIVVLCFAERTVVVVNRRGWIPLDSLLKITCTATQWVSLIKFCCQVYGQGAAIPQPLLVDVQPPPELVPTVLRCDTIGFVVVYRCTVIGISRATRRRKIMVLAGI